MSFKKEEYSWKTFKLCVHRHPELEKLLPQQTPEEIQALDDSLQADGLRDAITICNIDGKQTILDGHTRDSRIRHLDLFNDTDKVAINNKGKMTLSEAIAWMYLQQLGRRNLTDKDKLHIIGKLYNSVKVPPQNRNSEGANQFDRLIGLDRETLIETPEDKAQNKSTAERLAQQYSTDTQTITKNQVEAAAQKAVLIEKVFSDVSIEDEKKLVNSKVSLKDLRKVNTALTNNPNLAEELTEELKAASTAEEVKEVEKKVKSIAKDPEAFTTEAIKQKLAELPKMGVPVTRIYHSAPSVHPSTEKYQHTDVSKLNQEQRELFDHFIEHGIAVATHKDEAFVSFCKNIEVYENIGRTRGNSTWMNPYSVGTEGSLVKGTTFNCGYDDVKEGTRLEVLDKYRNYFSFATGHHQNLDKLIGKILFCHCGTSLEGKACHGHLLEEFAKGNLDPLNLSTSTSDLILWNNFDLD